MGGGQAKCLEQAWPSSLRHFGILEISGDRVPLFRAQEANPTIVGSTDELPASEHGA